MQVLWQEDVEVVEVGEEERVGRRSGWDQRREVREIKAEIGLVARGGGR